MLNVHLGKHQKNSIDSDREIVCSFIFNSGKSSGILSFLLGLGKKEYLVFSTFRNNLFGDKPFIDVLQFVVYYRK